MLDGQTLVLNRSWVPVQVAPVTRALTLLYVGHARAVHPEDYSIHDFDSWCDLGEGVPDSSAFSRFTYTTRFRIPLPDVVLLTQFNGFVRHEVRFSRQSIFERDGAMCQYCGKRYARSRLTLDHVVPASRGGGDCWENLVVACHSCNVRKADRTPEEAQMELLRRPKKPAWVPHFGKRASMDQMQVWSRFVDGGNTMSTFEAV